MQQSHNKLLKLLIRFWLKGKRKKQKQRLKKRNKLIDMRIINLGDILVKRRLIEGNKLKSKRCLSRAPDSQPRNERWLNGPNYNYSKLRKEEVIYKGSVYTNTRVLPLYTASASCASARDHVTWNAKTITLLPPFEKARPRALHFIII